MTAKLCFCFLVLLFFLQWMGLLPERQYNGLSGEKLYLTGMVNSIEEKQTLYSTNQIIISIKDVTFCNAFSQNESKTKNKSEKKQLGKIHGKGVICYLKYSAATVHIGDYVLVEGIFSPFSDGRNPGEFSLRDYYQNNGYDFELKNANLLSIESGGSSMRQHLLVARNYFADRFDAIADDRDAGIMDAMLLGKKTMLDGEIKQLYQNGGISHVLAISGLHISFLGIGLYQLLRKIYVPMWVSAVISGGLISFYVVMTGSSPSAIRALIMLLLKLIADIGGYAYEPVTALAFSGVLQAMQNPGVLLQSGFQLSYGAIMGLLFVHPILAELFDGRFWQAFSAGISIHLVTMPVLLGSFYGFSMYSFLFNLLVIPAMGIVLAGGLSSMMVGCLSTGIGKIVFFPVHLLLRFFQLGCSGMISLPGNFWVLGKPKWWQVMLYYLLLLIFLLGRKYQLRIQCLLCILGLFLLMKAEGPRPPLVLTILDVGQGDGAIGEMSDGTTFMIDCGSTSNEKLAQYTVYPFLLSRKITVLDYVFISHMDLDHISAVEELLEKDGVYPIRVDKLILPALGKEDEDYRRIVEKARACGTKVFRMGMGDRITDKGLEMNCLYPRKNEIFEDRNDGSMVLEICFKGFRALFMGDLDGEGEEGFREQIQREKGRMVNGLRKVTMLKAGHHGSKVSTSEELLQMITPGFTTISCGKKNRYGHPSAETVERIKESGSRVYITKDLGGIEVETDGDKCRIFSHQQKE